MKKLNFFSAVLLCSILSIFSSCSEDKVEDVLESLLPETPELNAPSTTLAELVAGEEDNVFETYTWTAAKYGDLDASSYKLTLYYNDDYTVLKETSELSAAVTVGEMDAAIKEMRSEPGATALQISVISTFEGGIETESDKYDIMVTPIYVEEEPVDEEPADEEPADEEPADEEPVDEEPADRTPHENDGIWGLIGSATPDGWDADQDLLYDAEGENYFITLDLVVGDIKFRKDDAWDVNLGGTEESLVHNGDNIAVAEAGNYTITLTVDESGDSAVGTFTIVKN
ncbi:SusF/SusE family outer membrane protein [Flammeovirga sp. SubArs3]|uniref:SusF/SusE family outer membrane protein n=1 Tax=Flammeovirga sp. SubArs3 TaxID=2995316 RepID=UPI00248C50B1|nr:SusF/SusE family outer membrane protein [Flammeovirga sp. SubArs3]